MSELELRFLGDLEVIRDGAVMPLPPSKKTRALLAYLALQARPFRREHLCELLWEIPDDPRGSLRWSLSKLRRVVDDAERLRIVADRAHVSFDPAGARIDVVALRSLAADGLAGASVDELETAASRYRGNFLEGLELSNFHDFHAWCVAERELATRAQLTVVGELVSRLAADPERAVPHARMLVGLNPYDERTRATLIRLLKATGRSDEAEQHFELGKRMLKEVGAVTSGVLLEALRGAPTSAARDAHRPAAPASGSPASGSLAHESIAREPEARAKAPRAAAPAAEEVLIGRDAEVARLRELFDETVARQSPVVLLLSGDPGLGKSRLLDALARHVQSADAFLLQASAFEAESIRPFALWIDALRRGGFTREDFAEFDVRNRDRLFAAISELIGREAVERPLVLLFDDAQWCDESSAAALHYVVRMNREKPFLCVLAARDGELRDNVPLKQALRGLRHDGLLDELRLEPLDEPAIRELIAIRVPGADDAGLSRVCGGNPLLAVELARAELSGATGSSLGDLVRERMARFDAVGGDVLQWAAVLNPRIDIAALVRHTGMSATEIAEVLEAAERHGMMQSTARGFRFSHDLIARSVYAGISQSRRTVMHRRIAERLEQDTAIDLDHAADLAHHALQSGDPGLAARAMVSAGRLCLRFFANDEALALARKGLQLAGHLSDAERVCLRLELFDVMLAAAPLRDWEAAADEYAALAEQALDHGALSHARLGYHMASYVRWAHGQWSGAREETLQAARVVRGGSESDHIVGMAEAAKCLAMLERDLEQADAMSMEAQALAVRTRVSHPALPAAQGMLRYYENRLDEAEELFKDARTLCKSAGDRVNEFLANEYLVMIDIERGDFDSARRRCRALLEIGSKLREGSEAPFARAIDGLCELAIGGAPEALDTALAELRIADAKQRLAYALNRAALLDLDGERYAAARERATEALEYAELLERCSESLLARATLAAVCRAQGDAAGYDRYRDIVTEAQRGPVAVWARNRAGMLLDGGGIRATSRGQA